MCWFFVKSEVRFKEYVYVKRKAESIIAGPDENTNSLVGGIDVTIAAC